MFDMGGAKAVIHDALADIAATNVKQSQDHPNHAANRRQHPRLWEMENAPNGVASRTATSSGMAHFTPKTMPSVHLQIPFLTAVIFRELRLFMQSV